MSQVPRRNPPGRRRKWRGSRSLVRLYLDNTTRDEVLFARGVVRVIHERDPEHPNINATRMGEALKDHARKGRKGLDVVPYPRRHCVLFVRRDTNPHKY